MRAVLIDGGVGSVNSLYIGERPVPHLSDAPLPGLAGGAEVLVKVKAFGLNRMDILQREGKYPLPPGTTDILGVEFSGTVLEVGPAPTTLTATASDSLVYHPRLGDEVFGLALGGAYAEVIRVRASLLIPKPAALSWEQAAAIPEVWLTAFQALRTAGLSPPSQWSEDEMATRRQILGLSPVSSTDPATSEQEIREMGKDVLFHAGASGVGLAGIQLARLLGARRVFATAGTDEKVAVCVQTGADAAFNYKSSDWAAALAKHNDLDEGSKAGSVDIIVDFVAGEYWNKNLASVRRDGRIVLLATLGGPTVPNADILSLILKRVRVEGSTLRSRSIAYQSQLTQEFLRHKILDYIIGGADSQASSQKIVIHKVFPWTQIQDAHRLMEANTNIGKIIATID